MCFACVFNRQSCKYILKKLLKSGGGGEEILCPPIKYLYILYSSSIFLLLLSILINIRIISSSLGKGGRKKGIHKKIFVFIAKEVIFKD